MLNEVTLFSLKGGDYYITERETDAFRIRKGTVLVYIVPLKKAGIGRRSFIYEASEGEVLPSFFYKDVEGVQWRFCFVALEEASIEIVEQGTTKVLKERFSKKASIANYKMEGYEGGLVDQYRINIVTEDGFINRSQKERVSTSEGILHLIYDAFHKENLRVETEHSKNSLYNTVALLCANQHIPIASYERMKEACGEEFFISDIARISNFAYREVLLSSGWQIQDSGVFLVFDEKKKAYACLPKGNSTYVLYDVEERVITPVSKKVAERLSPKAYMMYRPLPSERISGKDLVQFCKNSIRATDVMLLLFMTVITSLLGLLTPTISQKLYDEYIPLGAETILFQLGCVMASFMIANVMFAIVKNLVNFRLTSRMSYDVQGAIYNRLFSLQESFFRKYESADLAGRVMKAGNIIGTMANVIIMSCVAMVFLCVYFCRMITYSGKLAAIGLLMVIIYAVMYYLISVLAMKHRQKAAELEGKTSSLMFQFLSGISKIRIAGVEDRALYEYMKPYIKLRECEAKYNNITNLGTVLSLVSNSVFSIILYVVLIKGKHEISLGAFIAFTTMFGSFTAYVMQLVEGVINVKALKPEYDRIRPVFDDIPEYNDAKELPGEITGAIEINNVSFSYGKDMPIVLNNVNLNINPGEYVGIVGPSGCGKSTLMKLLLGFEKTTQGKIYYDNKDIENIDKRELRKKMGVVLQDGKLISGSIFENITITAPKATLADVKQAVKEVGLEKDISEMPMGLHTVLSEDCGTISGGQQQRILIARAIISKPKILFFDEATSALDNVTQSMVCETLEKMNSTRIVIAHRLSTIMKCDRIIVMEAGQVVEQGNYEELMEKKGLFYQLASRQMA